MAAQDFECEKCGKPSEIDVPDEYFEKALAWECPDCGAKNWTPGDPPHIVATAEAAMTDDDVVAVVDGDAGASNDSQV